MNKMIQIENISKVFRTTEGPIMATNSPSFTSRFT